MRQKNVSELKGKKVFTFGYSSAGRPPYMVPVVATDRDKAREEAVAVFKRNLGYVDLDRVELLIEDPEDPN